MKKFIFLYCGYELPTQEIKDAWRDWFASIGDKIVDSGNPFGPGREISHSGSKQFELDDQAITGYSIINAESIEEAEEIVKGCPFITSVRVYEAMAM